ncbi:hypothetical protein LTR94_024627, partial [Friedmanniomyces endolithicus]
VALPKLDLERFVDAQNGVFDGAIQELASGKKRGHWMWFVFPQARFLGRSQTARFFGIASLGEAEAYLADARLGRRLAQAIEAVNQCPAPTLGALFGSPDDLKYCSCMTLFGAVAKEPLVFEQALSRWGCAPDRLTLDAVQLARQGSGEI